MRVRHAPRGRQALMALALAAWGAGCASPGMPPGAPPDKLPPELQGTRPDSGATVARPGAVVFRFDEVINERPRGDSLSAKVVVSPVDGRVSVRWQRDRIAVEPRRGWRPATTYSVTLLDGISDLQGNATKSRHMVVFSTGGPLATGAVRGAVFDWVAGRPAPLAVVEAVLPADTTLRWVTRSDSSGRFDLGFMPAGEFRLRTVVDENKNGLIDPREPWDTVRVVVRDSARVELYAFAHDTLGPRLLRVEPKDTLPILRVSLDRPVAPGDVPDPARIRLVRADSTVIPVRRMLPAAEYDSAQVRQARARQDSLRVADTSQAGRTRRAREDSLALESRRDSLAKAQRDSLRARRDTITRRAVQPPPVPRRPVPVSEWVIELEAPLAGGVTYRLSVRDLLGLAGTRRSSDRSFSTPRPRPTAADSTGGRRPPGGRP